MRSTPPSSSSLALIPVPAPPPMIGCPAATFALSRARISSRLKRAMLLILRNRETASERRRELFTHCSSYCLLPHQLDQLPCRRLGEFGVVDVTVHLDERCVTLRLANRREEGLPRNWIVEWLPLPVDGRHAPPT